ncbi:MAG: hypothetical protein PHH60_01605 [Candidatus Margulisbacteria bacterium]|nr:hypothetical protein [Candidatus Margulisiibacteriota bacterium]
MRVGNVLSAFRRAEELMRQTNLNQLVYDAAKAPTVIESQRIITMSLAAQNKYEHLYTVRSDLEATRQASYEAYDWHRLYARVLERYPDPVAERGFRIVKEVGSLFIAGIADGRLFDVNADGLPVADSSQAENIQLAKRDALIGFMYDWCLAAAGNRPKNFVLMYRSAGATLSAAEVQGLMRPYLKRLARLSRFSQPETYYVISRILLDVPLPFNIQIPF